MISPPTHEGSNPWEPADDGPSVASHAIDIDSRLDSTASNNHYHGFPSVSPSKPLSTSMQEFSSSKLHRLDSHQDGHTVLSFPHQHSTRNARSWSTRNHRPPLLEHIASARSVFPPCTNSFNPSSPSHQSNRPQETDDWRSKAVGTTPLDRTMDHIGMGRYQWTLVVLSGLGYLADNMWLQAIAIILPHVQPYFDISDKVVGIASSSIFVGMFFGSLAWGTYSDKFGRRAAFNVTLLVTAIFGTFSAFATSFSMLCFLLFFVGTGVGGSMPTDSSNLVENLPVRRHNYVTALSVFFSIGAVVPSVIGLLVLNDNDSARWRWLLGSSSFVTVLFVAARLVFFRLLESPKYLVHAGRPQEARNILLKIQRFNGGDTLNIRLTDVRDDESSPAAQPFCVNSPTSSTPRASLSGGGLSPRPNHLNLKTPFNHEQKQYKSVPLSDTSLDDCQEAQDDQLLETPEMEGSDLNQPLLSTSAGNYDAPKFPLPPMLSVLPDSWRPAISDLLARYSELFSDEWKKTTILVWIIWAGMSYGFTTFNVFLPKLLKVRYGNIEHPESVKDSSQQVMIDYLLYSISSLPGSLISAYLVDTRLGRIGTMALSTAVTGVSVLVFAVFSWRSSLTLISIAASISYAAIYGYTPEVMSPKIRGIACGSASAISRVAGIIAPLTAGWLFSLNPVLPLYLAVVTFTMVVVAMAMLPIETRGRAGSDELLSSVH